MAKLFPDLRIPTIIPPSLNLMARDADRATPGSPPGTEAGPKQRRSTSQEPGGKGGGGVGGGDIEGPARRRIDNATWIEAAMMGALIVATVASPIIAIKYAGPIVVAQPDMSGQLYNWLRTDGELLPTTEFRKIEKMLGEAIKAHNETSKQLDATAKTLKTTDEQLSETTDQLGKVGLKLYQTEGTLRETSIEKRQVQADLDGARLELKGAKAQLQDAKEKIETISAELVGRTQTIETMKASLATLQSSLRQAGDTIAKLRKTVSVQDKALVALEKLHIDALARLEIAQGNIKVLSQEKQDVDDALKTSNDEVCCCCLEPCDALSWHTPSRRSPRPA